MLGVAHVEFFDKFLSMFGNGGLLNGGCSGEGRLGILVQNEVVGDCVAVDHAVGMAVFGHMAASGQRG
jgi:hypothetical protein